MAGREGGSADRLLERSRRALEGPGEARGHAPAPAPDLDDFARLAEGEPPRSVRGRATDGAEALSPGADGPGEVRREVLREAITPPRRGETA